MESAPKDRLADGDPKDNLKATKEVSFDQTD